VTVYSPDRKDALDDLLHLYVGKAAIVISGRARNTVDLATPA
jgi:hypothetical protein